MRGVRNLRKHEFLFLKPSSTCLDCLASVVALWVAQCCDARDDRKVHAPELWFLQQQAVPLLVRTVLVENMGKQN